MYVHHHSTQNSKISKFVQIAALASHERRPCAITARANLGQSASILLSLYPKATVWFYSGSCPHIAKNIYHQPAQKLITSVAALGLMYILCLY